jgi:benzoylformate decarboxylase
MAKMNIVPSSKIHDATRPSPTGISEAATLLIASKQPIMMVGDRVSDDDAIDPAVELAELLGLPVYVSRGAEVSFPTTHPQYFGTHSLRVAADREILKGVDLMLAVGMDTFDELFYWGDVILEPAAKLIHIDPIPGRVGKSEPTDVGIVAHCGLALTELIEAVKSRLTPSEAKAIQLRTAQVVRDAAAKRQDYEHAVAAKWNHVPMSPARMMYELANAIPDNAIVVDDAISNRGALRHYFKATKRGDIRGARGQSIGAGIGVTMGTQCAHPDRPVFGIIGDGSAMMTIQGLWTAANDNIPCIFVICNNGMYRVLKVNFNVYQREILNASELTGPNLPYSEFPNPFDIAAIANSMGVRGERIVDPREIKPAVDRAIASGKPALLDIVIDGSM